VVLGTERIVDGAPRLTALVIDRDGTIVGFRTRCSSTRRRRASTRRAPSAAASRSGPLTFGVAICHEGWRYPETVRWAARRGAHVVFHPHFHEAEPGGYRPTAFADPLNTFHEKAMLCRAAENGCYFASVNCASDGSPDDVRVVVRPDWDGAGVGSRTAARGMLVARRGHGAATGAARARCRSA
jgi:predicted amidohydrolase